MEWRRAGGNSKERAPFTNVLFGSPLIVIRSMACTLHGVPYHWKGARAVMSTSIVLVTKAVMIQHNYPIGLGIQP